MKIKAIVKKLVKCNPNTVDETMGGYRLSLDFGEIYSVEALALFALSGTEIILDVELNVEK
jgi:hypothetical protein